MRKDAGPMARRRVTTIMVIDSTMETEIPIEAMGRIITRIGEGPAIMLIAIATRIHAAVTRIAADRVVTPIEIVGTAQHAGTRIAGQIEAAVTARPEAFQIAVRIADHRAHMEIEIAAMVHRAGIRIADRLVVDHHADMRTEIAAMVRPVAFRIVALRAAMPREDPAADLHGDTPTAGLTKDRRIAGQHAASAVVRLRLVAAKMLPRGMNCLASEL